MSTLETNPLQAFHWEPQPEAERLVHEIVEDFVSRENGFTPIFRQRLLNEAGVRLVDLIDTITLPDSNAMRGRLSEAGYIAGADPNTFTQPNGIFPPIVLADQDETHLDIKVD